MHKRWFALLLSLFVVLAAIGCDVPTEETADTVARLAPEEIAATVLDAMDPGADPCDDFYRYACGGWLDTTEIPPDQSRWGRVGSAMREANLEVLREILEAAAENPGDDPDTAKIGEFYAACMDESAVDATGVAPLHSLLAMIEGVDDVESFMAATAELWTQGILATFSGDVFPDFKNPDLDIAHFAQGGLALPDRDYYLAEDKKPLVEAYRAHIATMFGFLGLDDDEASRDADAIVAFETELSKISKPRVEMQDPTKNYHKIDLEGLKELSPDLAWDTFLEAAGHPDVVDINVMTPEFFEGLQRVLGETPVETLRAYLRWHALTTTAPLLTNEIAQADFEFFRKRLRGQQEMAERWKRCVGATDAALGDILAAAFVERMFPGDSKTIAVEMIGKVEAAFDAALPDLAWMDDGTRVRASEKMEAISNKIGYPDQWRDYSGVEVGSSYFENTIAANRFEFHRAGHKIGNPVDRGEWFMTAPTVNAYYNPLFNEIVFPAGIMQPPLFHRDYPAAINYGAIGSVMGHELTHGFDDSGRKFDPKGRMVEWWEPSVAEQFEEAAECMVEQYNGYEVQEGLPLNGELTLGENIADNGGVKEAYRAYKMWIGEHGSPAPVMEQFTDDQLFFIGYAQVWCTLATPEIEQMMVTVDTHSHPRYRVIGPLSNSVEFAQAFSCAEGSAMNPANKCEVW